MRHYKLVREESMPMAQGWAIGRVDLAVALILRSKLRALSAEKAV